MQNQTFKMPGRPKKPTAVKKAQGTDQKCRTLENEMSPSKVNGVPGPPTVLSRNKNAMKLWHESVLELKEMNMLHGVDLPMLAAYCMRMSTYFEMEAFLAKNGRVDNGRRRAEDLIARDSLDQANKICQQFGFVPSARTKISMPDKKKENEYFD